MLYNENDNLAAGIVFLAFLLFFLMFVYYSKLSDKDYVNSLEKGQVSKDEEEGVTF